jgi:hypothetical protein
LISLQKSRPELQALVKQKMGFLVLFYVINSTGYALMLGCDLIIAYLEILVKVYENKK